MAGRQTFSDEFINRFVEVYSKRGRDDLCIETLRNEFASQYPFLTVNSLSRLRQKRRSRFEKARDEHLIRAREETGKRERDLLARARDLNSDTAESLMDHQEEYLEQLRLLDREDGEFESNRFGLLKVITSLQKEINTFAGLDFQTALNEFTQKLLRKKIIDEKDISFIEKMFSAGSDIGSFEQKSESIPRLNFVEDDQEKETNHDEQD